MILILEFPSVNYLDKGYSLNTNHNSEYAVISIGRKLFEEVDRPIESKIISEDAITKAVESPFNMSVQENLYHFLEG